MGLSFAALMLHGQPPADRRSDLGASPNDGSVGISCDAAMDCQGLWAPMIHRLSLIDSMRQRKILTAARFEFAARRHHIRDQLCRAQSPV